MNSSVLQFWTRQESCPLRFCLCLILSLASFLSPGSKPLHALCWHWFLENISSWFLFVCLFVCWCFCCCCCSCCCCFCCWLLFRFVCDFLFVFYYSLYRFLFFFFYFNFRRGENNNFPQYIHICLSFCVFRGFPFSRLHLHHWLKCSHYNNSTKGDFQKYLCRKIVELSVVLFSCFISHELAFKDFLFVYNLLAAVSI